MPVDAPAGPWGPPHGPVDPSAIVSQPPQPGPGPEHPAPHPGDLPGSWGPQPAAVGPWAPPGNAPDAWGQPDGNAPGPWAPPGNAPDAWGQPGENAPAAWGPPGENGPGTWGPSDGNGPGSWGPPQNVPQEQQWGPPGGNGPTPWGPPNGGQPGEPPPAAPLSWGVTDDAAPPVLASMPGEPEPVPIVETTAPFRRPTFTGPLVLTDQPQGRSSRPEGGPEQPPRPLEHILHAAGPLAPEEAAAVGLGVLDLLAPLHEAGRFHGDLRPETILVGGGGQVTLADPSPASGTSAYTAPEGNVGPAADLWSLGATLFTAVEGRAPAPGAPLTRAGVLAPVLFRLLSGSPRQRLTADELRLDLKTIAAASSSSQP
ncbi:hypothetical protein ACFSKW_09975 [Nonomuraea mangrovi]|uniref:Protein kinase domain-containing protein n=1 Tax=Nonomuraea mangrovi TaxID=2316207 RepID=A0ABW4SQJ0_9ACTN